MDDSIDNKQAGQTQSHLVWPPREPGDPWIVPPRPHVSRRVGASNGDEGVGSGRSSRRLRLRCCRRRRRSLPRNSRTVQLVCVARRPGRPSDAGGTAEGGRASGVGSERANRTLRGHSSAKKRIGQGCCESVSQRRAHRSARLPPYLTMQQGATSRVSSD